jgi:hypothetical protein
MNDILKHKREFARDLQDGAYELTPSGLLFPKIGATVAGQYFHAVNGGDLQIDKNLVVDEGLAYLLGVSLGATAKINTWYLALWNTNVTPASNWTAANFVATAGEITSLTEGYSEAVRQTWTPGAISGGQIDNLSSLASFTIATATAVEVYGAALLSSNVRGGASGTLLSAGRFATPRTLYAADVFQIGYRLTLSGV